MHDNWCFCQFFSLISCHPSTLPQVVKSTLAKDFAGYKIEEILKADAKGIITFEMTAQKDKKGVVLEFDINGKLLNQAEEKEEKDND
jgi:hypothetical protein